MKLVFILQCELAPNLSRCYSVLIFQVFIQISDGSGRECEMALWSHPGSDVTGMVARCKKIVDTSEKVGSS